jgi:hypothetical protein
VNNNNSVAAGYVPMAEMRATVDRVSRACRKENNCLGTLSVRLRARVCAPVVWEKKKVALCAAFCTRRYTHAIRTFTTNTDALSPPPCEHHPLP